MFHIEIMLSYVWTIGLLALTAHAGNLRLPPQQYIVGGAPASPGEYPSQLSLQYNDVHRCGASIISERFALTTAYCVCVEECVDAPVPKNCSGNFQTTFKLISGTNDLQSPGRVVHDLEEIFIREFYKGEEDSWHNDIAIIKVQRSSKFDSLVAIALHSGAPETGVETIGTAVKIVGWGSITEGGPMSETLLEANLEVSNITVCIARYGGMGYNVDSSLQICAEAVDGKRGSCTGDNGGPLLYMAEKGPAAVGLMSWGLGCERPGYPALYTRVGRHCNWINGIAGASCTSTQPIVPIN